MAAIIYHGEPNGPSLSVLAALAETGLDIECRSIDLLAGDRHRLPGLTATIARDMGIEGEGPVLVVDGEAMTEAVFIAQYLDEKAGGAGLQPSDAYAHWEMMMWCRQITERLSPAAALLANLKYSAGRLADLSDADFDAIGESIVSDDLRDRWRRVRSGTAEEAQIADSRVKVAQSVERCENKLADGRSWLMGDFSIADLETYAWLAGMELIVPEPFADAPKTKAWLERVKTRPSVAAALARATVAQPLESWAPGPEINRWG